MVKKPTLILMASFVGLILLGGCLLKLPFATTAPISWLDALFTATSAVCVTGLVVMDTADSFTTFGEIVILSLIQLGGLGFMTVSSFLLLFFKRRVSLQDKLILQESFNAHSTEQAFYLLKRIVMYTLIIELIGAVILAIRFSFDMPVTKAMYYGIFHAISMFNNAGFDLFGNFSSLVGYQGDIVVVFTVCSLILFGGLGFIVIDELRHFRAKKRLSLHSKVILSMTAFLVIGGTIAVWFFETRSGGVLVNATLKEQFLGALFHSVTPRTAGANTLPMNELTIPTLLMTIVFMFIGGGSGSTAGGVKIATITVLAAVIWSQLRGTNETILWKRTISHSLVLKAFTLVSCSAIWVFITTIVLAMTTDGYTMITYLFEATSAFGTVGLSLGITPMLSPASEVMIMLTMFIGRLGTLTILFVLLARPANRFRYPNENLMIG